MSKKTKVMFLLVLIIISYYLICFPCHARDITVPLNVPFFSQRDSKWGCDQLGSCTDFSKCNTEIINYTTIYSYGCFLTSKAMLFNYYQSNYTSTLTY